MALALDASTPARATASATSATTAAFTPPVGAILVVCTSFSGGTQNNPILAVSTITGSTSAWTQVVHANATSTSVTDGGASIHWATVTSSVSTTVRGTQTSGSSPTSIRCYVITGQHSTPIGASNIGAATTNILTTTAITTTAADSFFVASATEWNTPGGAPTSSSFDTATDMYVTGTLLCGGSGIDYVASSGASANCVLDLPGTANAKWCYGQAEIKAAGGTPGDVSAVTATASASMPIPTVSNGSVPGDVSAVTATATASMPVPVVTVPGEVSAPLMTATAAAPTPTVDATKLLTETWTGSDGSGWGAGWTTRIGTATIQSNAGRIDPGTGAYARGRVDNTSGMASVANTDMLFSVKGTVDSVEKYAYAFLNSDGATASGNWEPDNCYFVALDYLATPASSQLLIGKSIAGTVTTLSTVSMSLTGTTKYWVRFQRSGSTLQVRVWADGGSEPGTWDYSTTVSDGISGRVGFLSANGAATDARLHDFDDLEVTAGGTPGDVAAVTMTATATMPTPVVTGAQVVSAVTATATAMAHVPLVVTGADVAAVIATATAQAPVPVVTAAATVTCVTATATALALAPVVTGAQVVTAVTATATATMFAPTVGTSAEISAPTMTATATLLAPTLTAAATVSAVTATATALALAPQVGAGGVGNVDAVPATATMQMHVPTLAVGAVIAVPTATATAQMHAPTTSVGSGVFAVAATATAQMLAPTLSVAATVEAVTATAAASAHAPTVSAGAVLAAVRATATALALPPSVGGQALVDAPSASASALFRAPNLTAAVVAYVPTSTAVAAMWAPSVFTVDQSDIVLRAEPLAARWLRVKLADKYTVIELADRFTGEGDPLDDRYVTEELADRFTAAPVEGETMTVEVLASAGAVKLVGGTVTEAFGADISAATFEMSLGSQTFPGSTWVAPDVSAAGDTVASRVLKLKISSSLPAGIVIPGTYWCWARITAFPEVEPIRLQGPITVR